MTTLMVNGKRQTDSLHLDEGSIDPNLLSMGALMREINLRRRPSFLLRYMMNALENKRQKKLLGWSRPWNKTGMTVFGAHRLDMHADEGFLNSMRRAFWSASDDISQEYRVFAESLWADPLCMAFIFYHNRNEAGIEYEGLTLSIGRKLPTEKTKRDRLDIILEDARVEGGVDNRLDRVRIVVNPFGPWEQGQTWSKELTGEAIIGDLASLYASALDFYRLHRDDPERQWNHWAFRYIDYFGPRTFIPQGSAFI